MTPSLEVRALAEELLKKTEHFIHGEMMLVSKDVHALCRAVLDGGWVDCRERMPEMRVEVLAFNVLGRVVVEELRERRDGAEWVGDQPYEITHWRPLPAPPQEPRDGGAA